MTLRGPICIWGGEGEVVSHQSGEVIRLRCPACGHIGTVANAQRKAPPATLHPKSPKNRFAALRRGLVSALGNLATLKLCLLTAAAGWLLGMCLAYVDYLFRR